MVTLIHVTVFMLTGNMMLIGSVVMFDVNFVCLAMGSHYRMLLFLTFFFPCFKFWGFLCLMRGGRTCVHGVKLPANKVTAEFATGISFALKHCISPCRNSALLRFLFDVC